MEKKRCESNNYVNKRSGWKVAQNSEGPSTKFDGTILICGICLGFSKKDKSCGIKRKHKGSYQSSMICHLSCLCISLVVFALDVEQLSRTVNSMEDVHWVASPNPKFAHMSDEDFSHLSGILSIESTSSLSSYIHLEENEDKQLPESFDSQSAWPDCPTIGRIYDQGHCGSCWAMCVFEVFQDRICIFSGGRLKPSLSGQQLTSCDPSSKGCKGFPIFPLFPHSYLLFYRGWSDSAFSYLQSHGITTEDCIPYEMGTCKHPGCSLWATPRCTNTCTSRLPGANSV